MTQEMKNGGSGKADWRPKYLGDGIHDVALATVPDLTKADFHASLRQYLQERGCSLNMNGRLIDRLYRNTYFCRQQLEALKKMRKVVQGKDWRKREALLRSLPKKIDSFESKLGKYRNAELPLRDELVKSVTSRITAFNKSLKRDLSLAARLTANEKKLLSGYLKPKLESQFMLDIDNIVANRLRSLGVEERLLIVAGCIHAGKIILSTKDEEDLHGLINMRIHRARNSYKRESVKRK
jgi:hypothetical protein